MNDLSIAICLKNFEEIKLIENLIKEAMVLSKICGKISCYSNINHFFNSENHYDLIILETKYEGFSGFKIAKTINELYPEKSIVFYADDIKDVQHAFKVNAKHYLLKTQPYNLLLKEMAVFLIKLRKKEYIKVQNLYVKVSKIEYVEVYDHVTFIYTKNNKYMSKKSLKEWELELKNHNFIRCHRSYLVNKYRIKQFQKNYVELFSRKTIPVSRKHHDDLMNSLNDLIE